MLAKYFDLSLPPDITMVSFVIGSWKRTNDQQNKDGGVIYYDIITPRK